MTIQFFPRSWLALALWTRLTGMVVVNLRGITVARRGRIWARVWAPIS